MEVKRIERKFILNTQETLFVKKRLDSIMPKDDFCLTSDGYEVRSLYFDTISDRACAEKEDGLQIHEKIRARIYGNSNATIKLESKKKYGDFQVKSTMLIDQPTLHALCSGNYSVLLSNPNPMAMYFYQKLSQGMFPKAIIQYKRFSFCIPTNNTRITFDSNITATESNLDLFQNPLLAHPILSQDTVIMEVKYNHFLLGYIKDALAEVQQSCSSYSKYFNGRTFYRYLI